jgi:predicted transcriptional regulator
LERADRLYKLTPAGEEMLKELNEINSILQLDAPQAKKEISD